jgi:RHS repeat-associated protein
MLMPKRSYSAAGSYRYGFNGKEIDSDTKGLGNQYDYGFRIYDPRIGRFLSIDPLFQSYPWYTPYQFAGNTPIQAIDLDGLEEKYPAPPKPVSVLRTQNASESTSSNAASNCAND